jgi:protein-S-isoprenylcysteine O-methyltransferase Ste14
MAIIPGWNTLIEKVPELATVRGFLRAAATFLGVLAITLIALLIAEGWSPFLALVLQLAVYLLLRWLIGAFFRGRKDRVPYHDAFFNRFLPASGLNLASMLYVLLTAGAPGPDGPLGIIPAVVAWPGAAYLVASALLLFARAFQAAGVDTLFGVYVYYPDEGHQVDTQAYTVLRHPVYAALDRLTLAFGLWNGTAFALLLATVFVAVWHPAWYGIEERELVERFGDRYAGYREAVPAVVPSGLAGERLLWQTLFRR